MRQEQATTSRDLTLGASPVGGTGGGPMTYHWSYLAGGNRSYCPLVAACSSRRGPCWPWGSPYGRRNLRSRSDTTVLCEASNQHATRRAPTCKNVNGTPYLGFYAIPSTRSQQTTGQLRIFPGTRRPSVLIEPPMSCPKVLGSGLGGPIRRHPAYNRATTPQATLEPSQRRKGRL